MRQEDIFKLIKTERELSGQRREDFEKTSGTSAYGSMLDVLRGRGHSIGLLYVIKMLDALDLQLVVEDKDTNWGPDMARLRMMPKKLYFGERIETRELIREEGVYPRVDLFNNPDDVLKFVPAPCDIYEVRPSRLIRKKFDVIEHPFGTMYSYSAHIHPEAINHLMTQR